MSSSDSMSSGLLISQTDGASISSNPTAGSQLRELAEQVGSFHLREDVPLRSIEGGSPTDSSGGASLSRGIAHSRTPSSTLTPPPANASVGSRGAPVSRRVADSIDGRLGMSEIAAAIADIPRGSPSPGALLRPESPAVGNSSSPRLESRRRSSPRTNTAPHRVTDEEDPIDAFHEPIFQQAYFDAKRFMSELTEVLSSSPIHHEPDSTMRRLHEAAQNLAHFQCLSTRTVGFVGDSGVGKSSLLNSLLDFRGLARTSDSGAACTCVATEYHYHNTDDFAIEVEWFSIDEIVAQLTDLLQSYRTYHLRRTDIDQPELSAFKDRADVAQCTFQAMFKGHLVDELFLTQMPEGTVMETLRSWVTELLLSLTGHRKVYGTLEDCSTNLMLLTSEQNSTQEPGKWPFIRKVKVFSSAHILSKGLVLVDLPGLRDLNSARWTITERYLRQCDEIFAVCRISRATTDASVMGIFELARQANISNVGIICTKSDTIRAEEARRDWGAIESGKIQRLLDAIAQDQREIRSIEADLEYLANSDDDLTEEEVAEERRLMRKSKDAKKKKSNHEIELKRYLISTRNAIVEQNLRNLYRDKLPGNNLKVFCVGNHDYWEHRALPKDEALPFLRLSGIITIRKHCISIVADSRRRMLLKYITDDIPALLGDIELWAQSGAGTIDAERKGEIRQTLDLMEARMKQELTGNSCRINTIARSFKSLFREKIFARRNINNWAQFASNASGEWSDWAPATYIAFCRHYGEHETEATIKRRNWNKEAIEQMVRDLAAPWQDLKSTLQRRLEEDNKLVEELMDWAIENIDTQLHDLSNSATALGQVMANYQRLLLADVEQACEKFEADLSTLRVNAFSGIRTSFIGQLTEASYKKCNQDAGRGSDSRRKKIITERFSDEAVFESLQISFKNEFGTLAENLQTDIQAAVANNLSVIINTLNIVRNENVALESESDPQFRSRVEREVRAVMHEIRRLQGLIAPPETLDEEER